METLLSQAEQLPSLLAVSRSGLVRGWDAETLQRALRWGRFFQQLYSRLHGQPGLRAVFESRLRRGRRLPWGHWKRCPELLGLALLANRALPPVAYQRLLRGLLLPGGRGGADSFVALLARRRAASQLLGVPLASPEVAAGPRLTPQLRAQAQLLLGRLREEEEGGGEVGPLLDRLPRGLLLRRVVAAALLEPAREAEAGAALLPWLLLPGDPARSSAFCRSVPAPWMASLCGLYPELRARYLNLLAAWGRRLRHDPLRGEWRGGGTAAGPQEEEEEEVSWQELRDRVACLLRGPEPLRSAVGLQLRRLKAQDGDFEEPGLSVWTDLLLDMETAASENELLHGLL